jgi:hypothetical protein
VRVVSVTAGLDEANSLAEPDKLRRVEATKPYTRDMAFELPPYTVRDRDPGELARGADHAFGLSIPCMVSQQTKALNQPVLVVSFGYMPKPWPPCL